MEMFRPTRDGGASVWLSAGEATLLRTLVLPVMELLGERSGPADVLDDLEKLLEEGAPPTPEDPVLARLLPDAYQDDPEAAGEFRKYTESSLREAKKYFAQTLLDTLPPKGGRVRLTGDQARDDPKVAAFEVYGWLGAVQESLVQALARLADAARQSKTTSR